MQYTHDRLHYTALFIGQLLIWSSCSFFVGTFFLSDYSRPSTNDHHVQENNESGEPSTREHKTVDKEQVDENLLNLLKEVASINEHNSASISDNAAKERYAQLCSIYTTHCHATIREGTYSWKDKYLYQGLSIALMQQIDSRLTTSAKLQKTISELKIYKDNEDRRGSAGHTKVKINSEKIPTSREYREVLTHELGHIVDLGVLQGSSFTKNRSFTEFGKVMRAKDDPSLAFYQLSRISESTRKAEASYKDFVSGYAMKGIYEDFAETQNLWFNHNLLFQALAEDNSIVAKKYAYFKNLYGNKWFDDNPESVTLAQVASRSWDTTKIQ